ncbi:DeoR/GlpR family DNA-binding transcription regulator [Mycolicibacterium litorale]|uniref:DeoR/GlpR family DNA-binding transcription regulator n=1 Tax=Mycolicibacterium litorale TaxID=758802 RepID=UPI003CF15C04
MSDERTTQKRTRTSLLPEQRHRAIRDLLTRERMIRVEAIAEQLGVSPETIRRDVMTMEKNGWVRRVYGGVASPIDQPAEPPFDARISASAPAKKAMARRAAELVEPGATVFFDIGTSVAEVARQLPRSFTGRVVTTSLIIASELAGKPGIELAVAGGTVRDGDLAVSGAETRAMLEAYYPTIAFVGSGGIDAEAGLTDHYREEVATRRLVIAHSARTWILGDSSKLGAVAPVKVCDLENIDGLVTDAQADPDIVSALKATGMAVVVAGA